MRLKAIRWIDESTLEVCGDNAAKRIGWPAEDAYCDEPGVFERLKSAWEGGDRKAIKEAWGRAKLFTLS